MTTLRVSRRSAALVAALLVFATGAAAYWQAGGTGAGQVRALGSAADIGVSAASPSQTLLPGGSADVAARLTNPNPFPVHVSRIALDGASGDAGWSANAAGCALGYTTQTNAGAGWTVPASGSLDVDLVGAVSMGSAAASSCQGQTFSVYLAAS